MTRRNRSRKIKTSASRTSALLDLYTAADVDRWDALSVTDQTYRDRVYFDLEAQRTTHMNALISALRAVGPMAIQLDPDWCRITDWTWSNTPLSSAGSLKGIGQRFNIGETLDRARGQAFPCLYIGQDEETARIEKFGVPRPASKTKLSTYDYALRSPDAFTTFPLYGQVGEVLDLREMRYLRPFVDIIKRFSLSSDTIAYARKHKFPLRALVNSIGMLRTLLLSPPSWREEPQNYGIPAPSQIFGRLVRDAGFEGILYPSQRGGRLCLALFPENFRDSTSQLQVRGVPPPAASCYVLNRDNLCL